MQKKPMRAGIGFFALILERVKGIEPRMQLGKLPFYH